MAASLTALGAILGNKLISDTSVGTTVQDNVITGGGYIYWVIIDNTNNSAASYLKFWDATGSVTLGTTDPVVILKAPASTKLQYSFPRGIAFGSGICYACTNSAGTAGTSAPSSAVSIRFGAA